MLLGLALWSETFAYCVADRPDPGLRHYRNGTDVDTGTGFEQGCLD